MTSPSPAHPHKDQGSRHGRDLTVGSIPRNLILFSLPMLMGNVLQTAYSVVNAVWVGKFLGKSALAAVSVSFPVVFALMALAGGLTMAANILISQYAGAREWPEVKRVVQTSTIFVVAISVALMVVGEICAVPLLKMMATPPEVMPLAVGYLHILLLTLPFQFVMFLLASMLRGVGDSTTPLYFQTVFLIITAVLDPLLMFGWLGFPKLGLNGTAVAMFATMACASASLFIYLARKRHVVAPDWRNLRPDWAIGWLTLKIGMPSALQQALVAVGAVVVVTLVNHFGENAAAAFGAALRIDQIAFMPAMTTGLAVSTLAGQNIGAKQYHRVHQVFWWGLILGVGITLVVALLAYLAPGFLMRMFVDDHRDPEVIRIGIVYLRIMAISYIIYAVMFTSNGIINGAGHTVRTTIFTLIALWLVRVPMAALFSQYPVVNGALVIPYAVFQWHGVLHLPVPAALAGAFHRVEGIWYAMVASVATGMVISLVYYASGLWKRAIIKHRLQPVSDPQATPVLSTLDSAPETE